MREYNQIIFMIFLLLIAPALRRPLVQYEIFIDEMTLFKESQ